MVPFFAVVVEQLECEATPDEHPVGIVRAITNAVVSKTIKERSPRFTPKECRRRTPVLKHPSVEIALTIHLLTEDISPFFRAAEKSGLNRVH